MDEDNQHVEGRGSRARALGSWAAAIGIGVVTFFIILAFLTIALTLLLPDIAQGEASVSSVLYGIGILLVSIGAGIAEVLAYRPRK